MTSQHFKTEKPTDKDLKENPGIGTSKGTTGAGEIIEDDGGLDGDNTFEGDVENDVTPEGGVDPKQTGRTNK